MSGKIVPIGASRKLSGQPLGGRGFYINERGEERWRCRTADGGPACIRLWQLRASGWWFHMTAPQRVQFHLVNSGALGADGAHEYRCYLDYLEQADKREDDGLPAKNKTPSGGNR